MPLDPSNQKRLRDALQHSKENKENQKPKALSDVELRKASMVEKWEQVLADICAIVKDAEPLIDAGQWLPVGDPREELSMGFWPPGNPHCKPPLFSKVEIDFRNLGERGQGMPTVRWMHFEVQTSGDVSIVFHFLGEYEYPKPFDFMSSNRKHYEDIIARFFEKGIAASRRAHEDRRYKHPYSKFP